MWPCDVRLLARKKMSFEVPKREILEKRVHERRHQVAVRAQKWPTEWLVDICEDLCEDVRPVAKTAARAAVDPQHAAARAARQSNRLI